MTPLPLSRSSQRSGGTKVSSSASAQVSEISLSKLNIAKVDLIDILGLLPCSTYPLLRAVVANFWQASDGAAPNSS